MEKIKIIRDSKGSLWNKNDGTEIYSRDIITLLDYLGVEWEEATEEDD